jgi:hypothetical protein
MSVALNRIINKALYSHNVLYNLEFHSSLTRLSTRKEVVMIFASLEKAVISTHCTRINQHASHCSLKILGQSRSHISQ